MKITKGDFMKVGDLAATLKGNVVLILDYGLHRGKVDWYDVAFMNGNVRRGFPADQVIPYRLHQIKQDYQVGKYLKNEERTKGDNNDK